MQTIAVDDNGTKLAYLDSGPPSSESYTTLFAIHGMVFTSYIWEKVMSLAPKAGLRFVAINRRDYPNSTPLTPEEIKTITGGTDEAKEALLRTLSVQMATFIDRFCQHHSLPPLSADGKTGGFAVVGWSMGNSVALGVASYIGSLPAGVQKHFGDNLRSVVMQEVPDCALGIDMDPRTYTPLIDDAIPFELRIPFWMTWMTGYFQHGDLNKLDVDEISFVVPWHIRAPSVYNMSAEQVAKMADPTCSWVSELPMLQSMSAQLKAMYKRACFDPEVRGLLPRAKFWVVTGGRGGSFCANAYIKIQQDNNEELEVRRKNEHSSAGRVNFKIVPGGNHFMQWDDPEVTMDMLISTL